MTKKFKNELFDIRIKLNYSRLKVAIILEVSEVAIEGIENGTRYIRLDEAYNLGKLYNKTLDEIYLASKRKSKMSHK